MNADIAAIIVSVVALGGTLFTILANRAKVQGEAERNDVLTEGDRIDVLREYRKMADEVAAALVSENKKLEEQNNLLQQENEAYQVYLTEVTEKVERLEARVQHLERELAQTAARAARHKRQLERVQQALEEKNGKSH